MGWKGTAAVVVARIVRARPGRGIGVVEGEAFREGERLYQLSSEAQGTKE